MRIVTFPEVLRLALVVPAPVRIFLRWSSRSGSVFKSVVKGAFSWVVIWLCAVLATCSLRGTSFLSRFFGGTVT